jgi:hypothetical protein
MIDALPHDVSDNPFEVRGEIVTLQVSGPGSARQGTQCIVLSGRYFGLDGRASAIGATNKAWRGFGPEKQKKATGAQLSRRPGAKKRAIAGIDP